MELEVRQKPATNSLATRHLSRNAACRACDYFGARAATECLTGDLPAETAILPTHVTLQRSDRWLLEGDVRAIHECDGHHRLSPMQTAKKTKGVGFTVSTRGRSGIPDDLAGTSCKNRCESQAK